jgi:hypothetical protein
MFAVNRHKIKLTCFKPTLHHGLSPLSWLRSFLVTFHPPLATFLLLFQALLRKAGGSEGD